jgi:hypothetical protein
MNDYAELMEARSLLARALGTFQALAEMKSQGPLLRDLFANRRDEIDAFLNGAAKRRAA